MLEIIGKASYEVEYQGKKYNKIAFCLQKTDTDFYGHVDGILADLVKLKDNAVNQSFFVGDVVEVVFDKYGKPLTFIKV